ncbi:MAG: hypothetical protein EBR07_10795 [Planctomycetes bacterium]|nr:hypothetical protein [Planctomycetota bacterium]
MVAPAPAAASQPAALAPMVPSVVAPGSTATSASPTVASPSVGAAPTGAKAKFVFDPQPLAPLTMLVGPAIGALWLVTRRGVGSSAG